MRRGGPPTPAEVAGLPAATDTRWAAATTGGTAATDLPPASGKAVIAIGGWSGGDPAPTPAEFQRYVEDGEIAYYVTGGGARPGGSDIGAWVSDHFTARTVDGQAVHDLRG